jgi:hypothetical protein
MPDDLPLFLKCVAVAVPVGLILGFALRLRCPHLCERYAAWAAARLASRPWWVFVLYAAFFLLLTSAQVSRRWYIFAGFSAALAALELILMARTRRRRASSAGRSHGG